MWLKEKHCEFPFQVLFQTNILSKQMMKSQEKNSFLWLVSANSTGTIGDREADGSR